MSLENHPNFHVIQFLTDVIVSYTRCLRGDANIMTSPIPHEMILDFCNQIEIVVDEELKHQLEEKIVEAQQMELAMGKNNAN